MLRRIASDSVTAGDSDLETSLADLYAQHAPSVRRWVQRLAGPRAEVEDLIHDVFVIALRKRFVSRDGVSPRTWLFRITHNVVASRRRRQRLRRWLFGWFEREEAALAPAGATPLEELERRERSATLYAALDRLSDDQRSVLILYELEELSGDEVAALIGAPVNTVWARLHRGRKKLLDLLAQAEEEGT
jgi:RNA polymerase sigma-70 factor (ECF subfamily)